MFVWLFSLLGDIDDGRIVHPLWDKIIFSKLAELFGGRVKLMVSGAAPLPNKVMDFMRVAFGATLVEGYGLTETCAALSSSCKDDTTAGHVGIRVSGGDYAAGWNDRRDGAGD